MLVCVCVKVPIRPTCSSVKVDGTQAVMKICQPHSTVAKALPHDALQSCLLNAGVSIDRPVAPRCSFGTDRGGGRFSSGRNRAMMSPNWGQERWEKFSGSNTHQNPEPLFLACHAL